MQKSLYKRTQSALSSLSPAPEIGFVSQSPPYLTLQTSHLTLPQVASFRTPAPGGGPPRSEFPVSVVLKPRLYKRSQSPVSRLSPAGELASFRTNLRPPDTEAATRLLAVTGRPPPRRGVRRNAWKTRKDTDSPSPAFGRNHERLSLCRVPAERGANPGESPISPLVPHHASNALFRSIARLCQRTSYGVARHVSGNPFHSLRVSNADEHGESSRRTTTIIIDASRRLYVSHNPKS